MFEIVFPYVKPVESLIVIADEFECRTIQWEAAKNYLTRTREDVYLDLVSIRYFANLPWVSGRNN